MAPLGFFFGGGGGGVDFTPKPTPPSSPSRITRMSMAEARRFSLPPAALCLNSPKKEKRCLPGWFFLGVILVLVLVVEV